MPGNDGKNVGYLPLHTAADCNLKWNVDSAILKQNATATHIPDPVTGLIPFMLAGVRPDSNIKTVYEILLSAPGVCFVRKPSQ